MSETYYCYFGFYYYYTLLLLFQLYNVVTKMIIECDNHIPETHLSGQSPSSYLVH